MKNKTWRAICIEDAHHPLCTPKRENRHARKIRKPPRNFGEICRQYESDGGHFGHFGQVGSRRNDGRGSPRPVECHQTKFLHLQIISSRPRPPLLFSHPNKTPQPLLPIQIPLRHEGCASLSHATLIGFLVEISSFCILFFSGQAR